jgi:hypothetical protein
MHWRKQGCRVCPQRQIPLKVGFMAFNITEKILHFKVVIKNFSNYYIQTCFLLDGDHWPNMFKNFKNFYLKCDFMGVAAWYRYHICCVYSHLIGTGSEWYLLFPFSLFCLQCCGPGSGAFLTPGSGILSKFFRIPDPNLIFLRAEWQFLDKKLYNSL